MFKSSFGWCAVISQVFWLIKKNWFFFFFSLDVLNKTTDNDKVKEDITAMDENERKTRRSKRAKVDIS